MISDKKTLNLQSVVSMGKASFSICDLNLGFFLTIFTYDLNFISVNLTD